MKFRGTFLENLMLVLISCGMVFIIFELALRVFPGTIYGRKYDFPKGYFQNDPQAGFDITPNFEPKLDYSAEEPYLIWSNELGCFDRPYADGMPYILLAGDSYTWGAAPYEKKYGTVLENTLGFRVLKCGVEGYGTQQCLMKIKKILACTRVRPPLIVLGYCLRNDLEDDYTFPAMTVVRGYRVESCKVTNYTTWEKHEIRADILERMVRDFEAVEVNDSLSARIMSWGFRPVGIRLFFQIKIDSMQGWIENHFERTDIPIYDALSINPDLEHAWQEHCKTLQDISLLARKMDAKLLVVLIPSKEYIYTDSHDAVYRMHEWTARLADYFQKNDIAYMDLAASLVQYTDQSSWAERDPRKDIYWVHDGHFNVRGNRLAGLLIAQYILKNGLFNSTETDKIVDRIQQELKTLAV